MVSLLLDQIESLIRTCWYGTGLNRSFIRQPPSRFRFDDEDMLSKPWKSREQKMAILGLSKKIPRGQLLRGDPVSGLEGSFSRSRLFFPGNE